MAPKQQNVGSALFLLALLVAASVPRVEAAHDRKLLNIWDSITNVANSVTSAATSGLSTAVDAVTNAFTSFQKEVGDAVDAIQKNSTDAAESYKSTITSYGSVVVKVANAALDRIDDKSGSLAAALATAAANASSALDSARDKLTPGALGFNETNKEATLNTIAAAAQGTAVALTNSQVVQDAKGLTSDAARNATNVLTNVTRQFALLLSGAPGNSTRASSSS